MPEGARATNVADEAAFLRLLQAISQAANEAVSVESALQVCLDEMCAYTHWPVGHVYLPADDDEPGWMPTTIWHLADPERFATFREVTEATRLLPGIGLPGRVVATGEAHWIADVSLDDNFPRVTPAGDIGVRAAFGLPVKVGDEVTAVLEFFSPEPVEPNEQLLQLVAHLSGQLGRVFERARSEETRRSSEDRVRRIIETANDAFVAMNEDGLITEWNRQAELIFGWDRQEVVGAVLADTIIPDRYRQAHWEGLRRFLATGQGRILGQRLELEAVHRAGHEIAIELTVWTVPLGSGYSFNAFIHDNSQRKQAALDIAERTAELEAANEALRRGNETLRDFVAVASHELRTPLSALVGFASTLRHHWQTLTEHDRTEFLERMQHHGRRLNRLVENLLTMSQIDSGILRSLRGEVPVISFVTDLLSEFAPDVEVEITGDSTLGVTVDGSHFERILINLIENARKYGAPPWGVDVRSDGDTVRIRFSDSGPGVPPEFRLQLFDRFTQASRGATRTSSGTGLGLSIVAGLLRANDGEAWYEDAATGGACFVIELPRTVLPV